MKKIYSLCAGMLLLVAAHAQLDTIAGWTFASDSVELSVLADYGLPGNVNNYDIRAEVESTSGQLILSMTNGVDAPGDYAATAAAWEEGASDKFWSVKFKADGYQNFVLYSKQRSGGNQPGPRDWQVQYKLSSGTWTDVPTGAVTCANDWTAAVVDALALPTECNNPGSTSIYVRWLMTSDTDVNGDTVLTTGISKIDDIFILGEAIPQEGTVITGWTFLDENDTEFNANLGLSGNLNYDLRAESENTGNQLTLTITNGAAGTGDFAATAAGWENGANDKFWSVKFKADGYSDFRVSSKMRSGENTPGPKYWKLQYMMSGGGAWTDIPGGDVSIANNWTTGVVDNLPIPTDINNPGTSSVYVRWIMTSNEDINGVDVLSDGICKIDDILVTALNYNAVEEVVFDSRLRIYPNPSNGLFSVKSSQNMEMVRVVNMQGQVVFETTASATKNWIDLSHCNSGIYFVHIKLANDPDLTSRKILLTK